MTYWLTGCANSASWLYTAARRAGSSMRLGKGEFVGVPTGYLFSPHDLFPSPPDEWVKRVYNCVRRTELPAGGHFAAYQHPGPFAEDVRDFFRPFRAGFR